jgi:16S rRNA (uracil1498-N3)-methyltransferase
VGKEENVTRILSSSRSESEPSVLCALFMALPKGEKMEYILQKSVELGVGLVVPVTSERCVVRLTPPEGQKKRERWQRIAEAAAKQSGRGLVPPVSAPVPFETALSMMALYQNKAVCYEGERSVSLSSCLQENMKDFAFLVGPKGVFPEGNRAVQKEGLFTVGLGKRILRTETAPLAVLSIVLYVTHNL